MRAHMKIYPIYKRYKSIFIAAILFLIILLSGCAGGGTEVGNPASSDSNSTPAGSETTPPSILNLIYFPASATYETGGGEIIFTGSVDFEDQGGDVSYIIIDIIDSDNNQVEQITEPIEGFSGQTSGTVDFTITIPIESPDTYTFEVYIMDESDNESNILTGTFSVTD